MSAQEDQKYHLTDQFVWKEIGGQVVVLQYDNGAYWTLNETGSLIWKLILEQRNSQEIVESVCGQFEVQADTVQADYDEMVRFCLQKEMLIRG